MGRIAVISGTGLQVSIDGRGYPAGWGTSRFEVPADRTVSVAVMQMLSGGVGRAHVILSPDQPPVLEYRGPAHLSRPGDLGAPGTTKSSGLGCQAALLVVFLLLLAVLIAIPTILLIKLN